MTSTRFTAKELITHEKDMNLLFCMLCAYAVNPGWDAIKGHFKRNHKGITDDEKQLLKVTFADLTTLTSASQKIGAPAADRAAIHAVQDLGYCRYLKDPVPGFKCTITPDCRHCTTTTDSMGEHAWKEHRGQKIARRAVYVQSLFNAPSVQWFEVEPLAPPQVLSVGQDEAEVMAAYEAAQAAHQRQLAVVSAPGVAQPNMFEDRMGWALLLSEQDVANLARHSNPDVLEEQDVGVDAKEIYDAATEMVRSCHSVLRGTDHIILRYLYSVDERISETPLEPVRKSKTVTRYGESWARFVVFCVRLCRWSEDKRTACAIRMSSALLERLDAIVDVFTLHTTPQDRAVPLEDAIFNFSTAMLSQRIGARQNESPLLYFLAVDGWQLDGNRWKNPKESSGILSAMVYVLRAVAGKELDICRRAEQRSTEADFSFIQGYHRRRLTSGCGGVFDEIFNRRSFTMSVAKDWYGTPKMHWSLHRDVLSWDGDSIKIADIKHLMEGLLDATEEWVCELLAMDKAYLLEFDPGKLREDLAWANAGGSILDMNPCLQDGVKKMIGRGQVRGAYWSNIWRKSRADRLLGK
jgi:hypothetical protein